MPSLPIHSHPYCRYCGCALPGLFDPAIQYRGNLFHFSCAMRTILEISRKPKPPPAESPFLPPSPYQGD